jgi:hypothetical protein
VATQEDLAESGQQRPVVHLGGRGVRDGGEDVALATGAGGEAVGGDPLLGEDASHAGMLPKSPRVGSIPAAAHVPDIGEILGDHVRLYDVTGERSPFA